MKALKSTAIAAAIALCGAGGAFAGGTQSGAGNTNDTNPTAAKTAAANTAANAPTANGAAHTPGAMSGDASSGAAAASSQSACAGDVGADRTQCLRILNRAAAECAALSGNARDDCIQRERARAAQTGANGTSVTTAPQAGSSTGGGRGTTQPGRNSVMQ